MEHGSGHWSSWRKSRDRCGGKKEFPGLLLGDSMCAKNTDTANLETKGYCHYKLTNGIKRHLLVDVPGNPYFVHWTPADVSDDEGLIEMIEANREYFLDLPEEQVMTILLDNGYHKDHLEDQIRRIDPELRNKIVIALSPKITPEQKAESRQENPEKRGFDGGQNEMDRGAHQRVDQSMPCAVEEL